MLKLTTLFSGSRGNCSLIQSNNTNILLDIGYSYKKVLQALVQKGLCQKDIHAIIITHEHDDHVCALPYWAKYCQTKIYAPRPIADYIRQKAYLCDVVEIDGSFFVGNVSVDVYECSHDSRVCCGYRFTSGNQSIASVTDTGCYTQTLVDFLSPCKIVQIESNHDVTMLKSGKYPYALKRRILSPYGHLSNDQCAEILQKLIGTKVKKVVLAHLSENNNTNELAFATINQMYAKNNVIEGKDVCLYVAHQHTIGETID